MAFEGVRTGTTRRRVLTIGASAVVAPFTPAIVSAVGQTRIKLRIVNSGSNTVLTMQELVRQQGFFEQFGLDVETTNLSDGNKVAAALISGDVEACMLAGFSQVIPAIAKGAPLKIIAGALLKSNSVIYSSRPGIQSVRDLTGKTIGVGSVGSNLYWLVSEVLRRHGVDPRTVNFVNVGSGTDVFKAVAAGVVDAGPAQVEFTDSAKKMNVHPLPDGAFWEQLPDYADQGSYTVDRTIRMKRDTIVRLLAAYGQLYRFVSSPDSKDAYLKARLTALGPKSSVPDGVALWDFIQKYQPYAVNLALSPTQVEAAQKINIEAGIQRKMLPYTDVVDPSLAADAVKLMGGPV
ncbi:ABC transporter substrate-binding protein [Roseomonas elaeocarpi]|uniref:ABC transporter substrate-binding protein n=1 Tax=Roseomonas elaeocarpi TaxID=907779 RepID=A0ABV6JPD2_9PROT